MFIQTDPDSPDATKTTSTQNPAIVASDRNAVKNTGTDRVSADINRLNRQFQNEIRARQALELKVEALSRQMAKLDDNLLSFKASNDSEPEANDSDSEVSGSDDNWFNEQALVDSGMSGSRASELKTISNNWSWSGFTYVISQFAKAGTGRNTAKPCRHLPPRKMTSGTS